MNKRILLICVSLILTGCVREYDGSVETSAQISTPSDSTIVTTPTNEDTSQIEEPEIVLSDDELLEITDKENHDYFRNEYLTRYMREPDYNEADIKTIRRILKINNHIEYVVYYNEWKEWYTRYYVYTLNDAKLIATYIGHGRDTRLLDSYIYSDVEIVELEYDLNNYDLNSNGIYVPKTTKYENYTFNKNDSIESILDKARSYAAKQYYRGVEKIVNDIVMFPIYYADGRLFGIYAFMVGNLEIEVEFYDFYDNLIEEGNDLKDYYQSGCATSIPYDGMIIENIDSYEQRIGNKFIIVFE